MFAFCATTVLNRHEVKQSLQLGPAAPAVDGDLAAAIDALAARYGLKCSICEPLASGRMYVPEGATEVAWLPLYLVVSLDTPAGRLDYDAGSRTLNGRPLRTANVASLNAALIDEVRSAFPSLAVTPLRKPTPAKPIEISVTRRDVPWEHREAVDKYERMRATTLVAEVAALHGLQPEKTGNDFHRGRLIGLSSFTVEREVAVSINRSHGLITVVVSSRSEEVALQQRIASDLRARLGAVFGVNRMVEAN